MALEMKKACQKCETELKDHLYAYICVYECTFCTECTKEMKHNCPNCGGELVKRPRKMNRTFA